MLELTTAGQHDAVSLPVPERPRWQPLRAGLVDLFLYDHEEFRFRDGKLLLRGNNGTGKSKVLALLLPFLLDGDLSPSRVEPDGDRGKRMEWNLLLGGQYDERLGYTWLELGRLGEDGEAQHLTLGCGLKAVAGRGIAAHWFFITAQRVGQDLWLIGRNGTTLTRERLEEAIGARGQVFQQKERYRRAVDEHLFHLGELRYDALVNLLVQLRQPQLSKRPDEGRLSAALSEALTPADQAVLSDVAAAFHDLEQQRLELRGLEESRDHVARFLDRYRRYAQIAARRQAEVLRRAHAAYVELGRHLGAARAELAEAERAEREAATRLETARRELGAARARERELSERRELHDLATAEERAEEARTAAGQARGRRQAADEALAARRAEHEAAGHGVASSRAAVEQAAAGAAADAAAAGIERDHHELTRPLDLPDGADEPGLRAAARAAADAVGRRERAVRHVASLVEAADRAHQWLTDARRRLHDLERERDTADERRRQAAGAVTDRGAELAAAWRRHLAGLAELVVPAIEDVETALLAWVESLDGENPAPAALHAAAVAGRHRLAEALAGALQRSAERQGALAVLVEERERLGRGETGRPPAPYTREAAARVGRAGAPLWQVVDFHDGLPPAERAGLEAALEASGLLDAWVTPDGRLLEPGTHDVVVTAGRTVPANLGHALVPAIDPGDVGAATIAEAALSLVLAGIGLGAATADTWVEPSGRWRLGVAEGQWAKPVATFIGRGAREAARRRRLSELADEITAAEAAVTEAEATAAAIRARQQTLEAELAGAPNDQPLRNAHAEAAIASRHLDERIEAVGLQQGAVSAAESAAKEATDERDRQAAELALPADGAGLEAVQRAANAYRTAAAALWPAVGRHLDRLQSLQAREREVATAVGHAAQLAGELSAAERREAEAVARLDALRHKLGATVEEIHARLASTRAEVKRLDAEEKAQEAARLAANARAAAAGASVGGLEQQTGALTEQRNAALAAFQRFAVSGLLTVALPEVETPDPAGPWAAEPAVRVARRMEQALTAVDADEGAWSRAQRDFQTGFRELGDALRAQGHHASAEPQEDRYVVSIVYSGRERRPDELADLLVEEIEHRERLLSARERDVLEEHLVNEVASNLQELITDAEAQVERMNEELERRPTSTGMRLRFRWQPDPDGPPGLAEARRRLLRQSAEAWSPDDRAAVSAFLQSLIAVERARNETGTWLEHLTRAFDYRTWHRFTIERWQDGRWRPAGGPASGGERVLTVTLPLFAAASAHYRSAHPAAPRLVMLDEAFAGVDDDSRAKCLGLVATFDLDLAMTSEREWACYPTVPGIAIHHLTRREGVNAVHVSRWEWDGAARTQVNPPLPPAAAPPAAPTE